MKETTPIRVSEKSLELAETSRKRENYERKGSILFSGFQDRL